MKIMFNSSKQRLNNLLAKTKNMLFTNRFKMTSQPIETKFLDNPANLLKYKTDTKEIMAQQSYLKKLEFSMFNSKSENKKLILIEELINYAEKHLFLKEEKKYRSYRFILNHNYDFYTYAILLLFLVQPIIYYILVKKKFMSGDNKSGVTFKDVIVS